MRSYGYDAFELVLKGRRRIHSYFASIQANGEFKGKFLKEVFHKLYAVPPLLSAVELEKFLSTSEGDAPYTTKEALRIIETILVEAFNERGLRPVLIRNSEIDEVEARLFR